MILGILIVPPPPGKRTVEEAYEWLKFFQLARRQGDLIFLMRADWIDRSRPEIDVWVPRMPRNHTGVSGIAVDWLRMRSQWPDVIWDRGRWQAGQRFQHYQQLRRSMLQKSKNESTSPLWMNGPFMNKNRFYRLVQEDPLCPFRIPDSIRIEMAGVGLFSSEAMFPPSPSMSSGTTAWNEQTLSEFVANYPSLYLKPVNGTGGRGILRLDRQKQGYLLRGLDGSRHPHAFRNHTLRGAVRSLCGWIRMKSNMQYQGRYVLQQTIHTDHDDGRVKDVRVLVQKDHQGVWRVTGMAMRSGGAGQICSNLHADGHAAPVPPPLRPTLADTALRTAGWLDQLKGLHPQCEYGIDLALDPQHIPYVLEVNPKPGRKLFRLTGDPLAERLSYERPLAYANYMLTQTVR